MRVWVVISICAAYALVCLLRLPPAPIMEPDSAGYLGFAPMRTLGYPIFLKLVGANAAIAVQPVIYAIAVACLGVETLRATSSLPLAAAVSTASIVIPDLFTYHASILTESLFMSGLTMFLAATIRFVRERSTRAAALAATLAGLTATVRSTAYAFLPVLVVMVLVQWRRLPRSRFVVLAAATVPMLSVSAGERIAAGALHGENLTSLMGRHLFAKAGMINAPPPLHPPPDALHARLEATLEGTYAPIRRIVDRAPGGIRSTLTLYYEGCLQARCVEELRRSIALPEARLDSALVRAGLARIRRAPRNFVALTATHYRSFWTIYKLRHPVRARLLNAFIASNRPLPFEIEAFALNRQDTLEFRPSEPVRYMEPIVILIGWFTGGFALLGLAAGAGRRPLPPAVSVACSASLTAHCSLLFSALLAAGISRFVISVWPAVMTAVLFGGWSLLGTMMSRPRANQ